MVQFYRDTGTRSPCSFTFRHKIHELKKEFFIHCCIGRGQFFHYTYSTSTLFSTPETSFVHLNSVFGYARFLLLLS